MQRVMLSSSELRRAADEFSTTARISFNPEKETKQQGRGWCTQLRQIFFDRVAASLDDVFRFYDGTALQSIVEQARTDVMRIVSQSPIAVIKDTVSQKPRNSTASHPPEHGIHVTLRSDVLLDRDAFGRDAVSNEALRNVLVLIFVMRLEELRKKSIEILYDEIQHLQNGINKYEQLSRERISELTMLGSFRPREKASKTERRIALEDAVNDLKVKLQAERLLLGKKETIKHRLNSFEPPLHQPIEDASEQFAALTRYATSFEAFIRSNMRQDTLPRFDKSNLNSLLAHEVILDALPEEARVVKTVGRVASKRPIAYIGAAVAAAVLAGAGIAVVTKSPRTCKQGVDICFPAGRDHPIDPITELREELTKNPFKINFSVDPKNPNNVVYEIQTRPLPPFVSTVEFLFSSDCGAKYDSGLVPFANFGKPKMRDTWSADYLLKLLKSGKRGVVRVYGKNQFGGINKTSIMVVPMDVILSDDLIARFGFERKAWCAQ